MFPQNTHTHTRNTFIQFPLTFNTPLRMLASGVISSMSCLLMILEYTFCTFCLIWELTLRERKYLISSDHCTVCLLINHNYLLSRVLYFFFFTIINMVTVWVILRTQNYYTANDIRDVADKLSYCVHRTFVT